MKHKDENSKTQVKLPAEYQEYIDFYKGEEKDTFIAKLIKRDEEAINDGDDENLEDNDIEDIEETSNETEIIKDFEVEQTIDHIYNYITIQGYTYEKSLIKNLYISLKTKPFVILSGISGTGKSKIVELFARALGATAENERFNLIPIKPDWSDSTDLLAFRNIEGKFTPGVINKVCYKAMTNPEIPYFICLDEMNLAKVEYYFSDILSLMETRRLNEGNEIITNTLLSEEQIGRDSASYSSYERAIDPIGKDDCLKDEYFSNREVLVGALKSKEQLEVNLKHNFYHIPKDKINLAKNNIKYVALYQSKTKFVDDAGILWYGKIKNIDIVKRNEIHGLPKAYYTLYYKFEIEEWYKLENKIEISNHPIRNFINTTMYLLNNVSSVTELFIKAKEEFRLFMELKRIYSEISIETDNSTDDESKIKTFSIDHVKIIVDDDIMSVIRENVIRVSKDEFLKRPVKCIKELLRR